MWRSRNGSLVREDWLSRYGGWSNNMQFLVGNFDGASGPDVMVVWNEAGRSTLTFHRNHGSSFGTAEHWAERDDGWDDTIRWRAGDFDADGRADVLAVRNQGGASTLTVRRWVVPGPTGYVQEPWGPSRATWQASTDWCVGTFDGQ